MLRDETRTTSTLVGLLQFKATEAPILPVGASGTAVKADLNLNCLSPRGIAFNISYRSADFCPPGLPVVGLLSISAAEAPILAPALPVVGLLQIKATEAPIPARGGFPTYFRISP